MCCAGRQVESNAPGGSHRISLIIAWWGLPLAAKSGTPGAGPCNVLPRSSEALQAQHRQTWLADFELTGSGTLSEHAPEWRSAAAVAPAWVPVASSSSGNVPGKKCALHPTEVPGQRRGDGRGSSRTVSSNRAGASITSSLPLPGLRFFLRSADEIQRVYVSHS